MALKLILSKEEYSKLAKTYARTSFKAHNFFDKYIDILPVEILKMQYNKLREESQRYEKLLENSTCNTFLSE